MSAIHEFEGERRLFVKGALGDLLQVCDRTIVDGKVVPMTRDLTKRVQSINLQTAKYQILEQRFSSTPFFIIFYKSSYL